MEELRAAKSDQYDNMVHAEKEFSKARNELENEIKSNRSQIRELEENLDGNVIEIKQLRTEKEHLHLTLQKSEEKTSALTQELNVFTATSNEKQTELSNQLDNVRSELEKAKLDKLEIEEMLALIRLISVFSVSTSTPLFLLQ